MTLGALSAAVLALGGGALVLLQPGVRDGRLTDSGRSVFAAVSRALLDGTLPANGPAAAAEVAALLVKLDDAIVGLPPHVQSELSQLVALLATGAGRVAIAGLQPAWDEASVAQCQQALQRMRWSDVTLRRQAYQALHDLVGSAYFSNPATWKALGYPGPRKI
jgi:hypothetical protein